MVDDVWLTVYHMRNLPKEVRNRFASDMGFVVDYLNEGNLEGRKGQKIIHVRELCEMMQAVTGDGRFTELVGGLLERGEKKEGVHMCEYLDMLEARGQERGEKIGQKRGENRLARLISKLAAEKKYEEIQEASNDKRRRQELYQQYGIL